MGLVLIGFYVLYILAFLLPILIFGLKSIRNFRIKYILTKEEILASVETWSYIVKENAPLRILIDDNIVGVEESFFDNIILGFVTDEPQAQAHIMGKMLGKWHGCCDVAFVSKRIEHLIEAGKIRIIEEKVNDYDCYWPRTLALV